MQLRLDAADRLVELVEERRGPVFAEEAARHLFALRQTPVGVARTLLSDVVADDARLRWHGDAVALSDPAGAGLALESATYVVVDLETTGLRVAQSRICEIGAVRVRDLEIDEEFQTLVDPREPLGAAVATLTGLSDRVLRGAPRVELAMRRFLAFADDAVLVAHNARFDLAFLDRETERLTGRRIAAPVIDTVALARRLLAGRVPRASLAQLSYFFGTSAQPCHRALPDAQATAEVLLALLGLAQERGAQTVADVVELAATRDRRAYAKRHLAFGAPPRPGVYLFRDRNDQVLYVGRARDLRARLRSYFRSQRQRPAVEAALGACERIEWRVVGSELEAALEELRLIRELHPPANARVARPERYVYLKARGNEVVASKLETPLGPIRSRRRAQLAARALAADDLADPRAALPRLHTRLVSFATARRFEDAARLRDRIAALEAVCRELDRLARVRSSGRCLLVPAAETGCVRAFFVAGGRVASARTVRPEASQLEIEAGLATARRASLTAAPPELDELLLIETFIRRPPPELVVTVLDRNAILRALARVARMTS
jgi:DNA polymerase III epsilon subunit family exonuclease